MPAVTLLADEPFRYGHFSHARPPRLYGFLLGGREYCRPDRAAAADVYEVATWGKQVVLIDREHNRVSAVFSLGQGVRQFLDRGCGLPNYLQFPDLHHIIAKAQPGCPVVYVDHDPEVYAHGGCVLDESAAQTVIRADILAMDQLLTCDAVTAALDLTRPVGVSRTTYCLVHR